MAYQVVSHNPGPESYTKTCATLEEATKLYRLELSRGRSVQILDENGNRCEPQAG